MSGFDYSRFDKIEESDEEETELNDPEQAAVKEEQQRAAAAMGQGQGQGQGGTSTISGLEQKPQKLTPKGSEKGRYKFEYEGRTIYEWEQSLEEVNIYIEPPAGLPRHMIVIDISHKHLKVGIKGNDQAFLDEDTGGPVKPEESMWTMIDGEININLQKMNKAETWEAALLGRDGSVVDPTTKEEMRKQMMLDRFQEEHPGFDFSGAEFNGMVPEARDFLGGVKRS
jgi:hypothetical protein